jgi:ABC-2 type transport system permease protein
MMNTGLLRKAIRETGVTTLAVAVALFGFELLVAVVLPSFERDMSAVFQRLKFVQQIFAALLGTNADAAIGPEALSALRFVHPFVLTLLWAHAIILCTRMPAGEIDRGTADVLLSLPVTRMTHFLSESVVWVASGIIVIGFAALGVLVGAYIEGFEQPVSPRAQCIIYVNLLLLYLTVATLAALASSMSNHRGRAAAVVFGILAGSFVINTLATFNETIQQLSFLGLLRYYRPLSIMSSQTWPWTDLAVLFATAVILWVSAAARFSTREFYL